MLLFRVSQVAGAIFFGVSLVVAYVLVQPRKKEGWEAVAEDAPKGTEGDGKPGGS